MLEFGEGLIGEPVILLDQVDAYLGDRSSIGYDFLTFERPLLFYQGKEKEGPLKACGVTIDWKENPFKRLKETDFSPFVKKQRALYTRVFAANPTYMECYAPAKTLD